MTSEARRRIHDLLPWHVNGTLAGEEAVSFEAHLGTCPSCRSELALIEEIRVAAVAHGEEFFADHPDAEILVVAAREGLAEEEAAAVRRHIALCSTCAQETKWLLEGMPDPRTAPQPERARPARRPLSSFPPWAAAAAVVVLAAALGLLILRPASRATGVVPTHFVGSIQRAAGAATVEVPRRAAGFQILLQVDADPAAFPLALEVTDAGGRRIHREEGIEGLYRQSYLFLYCSRADFPDGDYVARVIEAGEGATVVEHPYTVVTEE